jgi:uncharacterized protein YndB with AHSA1/START domain
MADILQDFPIRAPRREVFAAMAEPAGLDAWWTARSRGEPRQDAEYELDFGPSYRWRARVTRCEPDRALEWELTDASPDWVGTRVGFELTDSGDATLVRFHHRGWPDAGEHYRVSCHCWAMYLRVLRRHLEMGERVPYEDRLNV